MIIEKNEKLIIEEMINFVESNWGAFQSEVEQRGYSWDDMEDSFNELYEKIYS